MSAPTPWKWDGPVWDYDPENDAPWIVDVNGYGVLTGEIRCISEEDAAFIVTACNTHAQLVAQNERLLQALTAVRKRISNVFVEDRIEDMIACRACIEDIDTALSQPEKQS